jgi:hypothetical protein
MLHTVSIQVNKKGTLARFTNIHLLVLPNNVMTPSHLAYPSVHVSSPVSSLFFIPCRSLHSEARVDYSVMQYRQKPAEAIAAAPAP